MRLPLRSVSSRCSSGKFADHRSTPRPAVAQRRPRGSRPQVRTARSKRWKPVTRWQAALLVAGALLLIPPIEVSLVGFINPPRTRSMVFYRVGAVFSRTADAPLR